MGGGQPCSTAPALSVAQHSHCSASGLPSSPLLTKSHRFPWILLTAFLQLAFYILFLFFFFFNLSKPHIYKRRIVLLGLSGCVVPNTVNGEC